MSEFTDPFVSVSSPLLPFNQEETIRALRLDLAAEEEAVNLYTSHAEAIEDPRIKALVLDIAQEERVHAGEFMKMIKILNPEEHEAMKQGADEVLKKFPEFKNVGMRR